MIAAREAIDRNLTQPPPNARHVTGFDSNPFSTRYTRPGAIPYRSLAQTSYPRLASLLNRIRQEPGPFQIVGPHGVGKSTLLSHLLRQLSAEGWETSRVRLSSEQRPRLPRGTPMAGGSRCLLAIDGFEQLSWMQRRRMLWHARHERLLFTTHRPQAVETLASLRPDPRSFEAIVRYLLRNSRWPVTSEQIREVFEQSAGDLREGLFQLYDLYESSRSTGLPVRQDQRPS